MKLIINFATLALLASISLAFPAIDSENGGAPGESAPVIVPETENNIIPPPSVEDCTTNLTVLHNTSLFWSGYKTRGYQNKAEHLSLYHYELRNYKTIGQSWINPSWPLTWIGPEVNSETTTAFWDTCSKAFAKLASGTAYVLLPPGQGLDWVGNDLRETTVWSRIEWPILRANQNLTIIRINLADMETLQEGNN